MSEDTDNSRDDAEAISRRSHKRVFGKLQAKLVVKSGGQVGPAFFGFTKDLSLKGLFIEFLRQPSGIKTGDCAVVELGSFHDRKVLSCRVAHVSKRGVGIELEISSSEFGKILSSLLFAENQLRLGTELSPQEQRKIVLQCDGGISVEAWIDKISISQLECIVGEKSLLLELAQPVTLSVPGIREATLHIPGVVRKVGADVQKNGRHGAGRRVAVLFSSMSEEMLVEIRALVSKFHQDRLDMMMETGALSLGADAGEGTQLGDRAQIGQQLDSFLGVSSSKKSRAEK